MDNNSFEEKSINDIRKEKVKNFHMNINSDDLAVGDRYRELENLDVESPETISSFSGDDVRKQMRRDTKNHIKAKHKAQKKEKKYIDRQNRRRFRIIWWVSVALVGVTLALFMMVGVGDMLAMNRQTDKEVTISIPENPKLSDVSAELERKGVIKESGFFEMYAKLTKNETFSQGDYKIKTNMDYEAIINYLGSMQNRTDTIKITIPEGMSVQEIAAYLVKKGVLSSPDHFLELCASEYFDEDYAFVKHKNDSKRYYKLEGYLFPDTYECYKNERAELTITRMLDNYEYRTTNDQNVDGYSKAVNIEKLVKKDKKYDMNEILTLASIIQAEAASVEDMYNVSSILRNRLEYDVDYGVSKLGLDSTKYYPYRSRSAVPKDQRKNYKSRYDTYTKDGLPPGPICNPGMQAILAAIYPNDTNYLFFCHAKDGTPYYAATREEHQYNLTLI